MRVFLDTNVLASAAATRGLCADVLREVFAYHALFISEQVIRELRNVLGSKFRISQDLIDDFVWLLQQDTVMVCPATSLSVELQDKDDLSILGAAIAARGDVLVTGDGELLHLGRIEDTQILSPRQFWEKLRAKQRGRAGRRRSRRSR